MLHRQILAIGLLATGLPSCQPEASKDAAPVSPAEPARDDGDVRKAVAEQAGGAASSDAKSGLGSSTVTIDHGFGTTPAAVAAKDEQKSNDEPKRDGTKKDPPKNDIPAPASTGPADPSPAPTDPSPSPLTDEPKPENNVAPLVFTGALLDVYQACMGPDADKMLPQTGAAPYRNIGDYWTHDRLVSLYAPKRDGKKWVTQLFESLGWSDPKDVFAPTMPVHQDALTRFGSPLDLDHYVATAVRFRPAASAADEVTSPSHIKLSYTLARYVAGASDAVGDVNLIYAINVGSDRATEFRKRLMQLPGDRRLMGCAVHKILRDFLPSGQFRFVHVNVLDAGRWKLTEARPMRGAATANELAANLAAPAAGACGSREDRIEPADLDVELRTVQDPTDMMTGTSTATSSEASERFRKKTLTTREACEVDWLAANGIKDKREIVSGIFAAPGAMGDDVELRMVRMGFPGLVAKRETGEFLGYSGKVAERWVSEVVEGSRPDENLALVEDSSGQPITDPANPIFALDAAHTCAGCHVRTFGTKVDDATNKLNPLREMRVRHIGFGDAAGIAKDPLTKDPVDPMFGVPRTGHRASLSAYLMEIADPAGLNVFGYKPAGAASPAMAGETARQLTILKCALTFSQSIMTDCARFSNNLQLWLTNARGNDADDDGVPDFRDRCVWTPGKNENGGCP